MEGGFIPSFSVIPTNRILVIMDASLWNVFWSVFQEMILVHGWNSSELEGIFNMYEIPLYSMK